MGATVERLLGLAQAKDRFNIPHKELCQTQLEAISELFQERKDRIRLLGRRAAETGITEIKSANDVVPLLLPHTAYKSYPESALLEGRWDRLLQWLRIISPHPIQPIDTAAVHGIDDWIEQLSAAGHFVSCSSGTTGKPAMLLASEKDMAWSRVDTINVFAWGSGVLPAQDRMLIGCAPVAMVPKNMVIAEAQAAAFGNPEWPRWHYPVPPITVGSLTHMVAMRKAIANGTARPGEVAAFEETSREREEAIASAIGLTAEEIIQKRDRKLLIAGQWSSLYQVAQAVRERGYSSKDFNPDNCIYVGGGLKRAQLPPDYQQFVHDTFNIPADCQFQNYSMQELNSGMPRCREGGRYHVPPWVVPFILDKDGSTLLPNSDGEIEGRAAFFDLSLDGRWGGVITGDKISIDYSPCPCGNAGPSIRDNIVRYSDIDGDDKIGCAGTVDAYVRGVA